MKLLIRSQDQIEKYIPYSIIRFIRYATKRQTLQTIVNYTLFTSDRQLLYYEYATTYCGDIYGFQIDPATISFNTNICHADQTNILNNLNAAVESKPNRISNSICNWFQRCDKYERFNCYKYDPLNIHDIDIIQNCGKFTDLDISKYIKNSWIWNPKD